MIAWNAVFCWSHSTSATLHYFLALAFLCMFVVLLCCYFFFFLIYVVISYVSFLKLFVEVDGVKAKNKCIIWGLKRGLVVLQGCTTRYF